jgi:membrane fusion protein
MEDQLFRQAALAYQTEKNLGNVSLHQPLSVTVIIVFVLIVLSAILMFLFWGEYTRKERVVGYLYPDKGMIKIFSPQEGILRRILVAEGDYVEKGQQLFVLTDDHGSLGSANTNTAIIEQMLQQKRQLRDELAKQQHINALKAKTRQLRIDGLKSELTQLSQEIEVQRSRVASAENQYNQFKKLHESKHVAKLDLETRRNDYLDQTIRQQSLMRNKINLESELIVLQQELTASALQADQTISGIQRQISELQQSITEHQSRHSLVAYAPESGHVTSLLVKPGQKVNRNHPLFSILPAGASLEAKLLIPSRAIGFVNAQQTVAIRFDAFPYQRYGSSQAKLFEIAKTLTTSADIRLPVALSEPVYIATAAMNKQTMSAYGRSFPLQSGMTFEADIWLDTRRIIEWVFEPLYSLTRKV